MFISIIYLSHLCFPLMVMQFLLIDCEMNHFLFTSLFCPYRRDGSHCHEHEHKIFFLSDLRCRGLCVRQSCCWRAHAPGRRFPAPTACSPPANDGSPSEAREGETQRKEGGRKWRTDCQQNMKTDEYSQKTMTQEIDPDSKAGADEWRDVRGEWRRKESER